MTHRRSCAIRYILDIESRLYGLTKGDLRGLGHYVELHEFNKEKKSGNDWAFFLKKGTLL